MHMGGGGEGVGQGIGTRDTSHSDGTMSKYHFCGGFHLCVCVMMSIRHGSEWVVVGGVRRE